MEEFLTKLNIVSKNNQIKKLECQNKKVNDKNNKNIEKFKKIITKMEIEKKQNLKTIEKLTEINKKIQEENINYKMIIDKIPKWIIRFYKNKNKNKKIKGMN